jgi:late competence protein required for DNA uptake (superfamily II DNA/RNA helicase)
MGKSALILERKRICKRCGTAKVRAEVWNIPTKQKNHFKRLILLYCGACDILFRESYIVKTDQDISFHPTKTELRLAVKKAQKQARDESTGTELLEALEYL